MKRLFLLLAVLAAVALLGFACGDDDDDDGGGGGATTTVPADTGDGDETGEPTDGATGEPTDTGDGGQTSFDVEAIDFAFTPASFAVPVGEAVTFNYTNNSGTPHTFTVYYDEAFTEFLDGTDESGATSDTLELTFDTAQEYFFRCEVHPQMQGEIVAE